MVAAAPVAAAIIITARPPDTPRPLVAVTVTAAAPVAVAGLAALAMVAAVAVDAGALGCVSGAVAAVTFR